MPSNEANDRELRTMTPKSPMQPEPLANSICIRREDPLVVPPQNSDRRIAIRVSDWRRIKANLSRAAEPTPDFSGVYCALFGFSGSALLSAIPIALAHGLPAWVVPLHVCLIVFSSLCGWVMVRLSKHVRKFRRSSIAGILADVKEIDRTFEPDRQFASAASIRAAIPV